VKELEQIDRQLFLNYANVVDDRFRRIIRKTKNVAAVSQHSLLLPGQQHLAIFRNFVLLFLGAQQAVGIDVFQTDEDALDAGASTLFDEVRKLMTERIDLNDEIELQLFRLTHLDHAIENRFPVFVARKVIVGDEESVDTLRDVRTHDLFAIVGGTITRLAALHVDDRAERTLYGQPRPASRLVFAPAVRRILSEGRNG